MRNNIIKSLIALILVFSTSCGDYLELTPKNDLVQDEFWQNKEQVLSAVAGCYASMNEKAFNERFLLWGELRAEMLVSTAASSNAQKIMMNYMLPSNSYVNWANYYEVINYCNTVLAFAPQAKELDATFTEYDYARYMAEVKGIRALVYFTLVKNFLEVPLVLEATVSDQSDFYPTKSTEQEVLAQITADLVSIIDDLPITDDTDASYDKGRFNRGAAYSLLADIYLWNEQYDLCIEACQNVIDLGKYDLVQGVDWFTSLFVDGNSTEGIFELNFADDFSTLVSYFYVGDPDVAPYGDIVDLYAETANDVRGNRATYDMLTNSVFKYAGYEPKAGYFRTNSMFFNNWIFYRYADVLLMQAEAYVLSSTQQSYQKAYDLTNMVHTRATSTALESSLTSGSLLTAILLERQKEFAFEGKRWYDLLRNARRNSFEQQYLITDLVYIKATADNFEAIKSYYSDTASYFFPIYQNELDLNHNLEQNPYYLN